MIFDDATICGFHSEIVKIAEKRAKPVKWSQLSATDIDPRLHRYHLARGTLLADRLREKDTPHRKGKDISKITGGMGAFLGAIGAIKSKGVRPLLRAAMPAGGALAGGAIGYLAGRATHDPDSIRAKKKRLMQVIKTQHPEAYKAMRKGIATPRLGTRAYERWVQRQRSGLSGM